MAALFACTKCSSRHPFEELSQGQQLCKDCRGSLGSLAKCTYCRTEFQDSSKGSPALVCKKCEANVKMYGKPKACDYCNIIAAFIGAKCQRCTNSEKKYGAPVSCEQCKQRCAFDRKDESRKKVDGKLLCWLCTLSYKRALAKTKQASHHALSKSHHHASQNHKRSSYSSKSKKDHSPNKKARLELTKSANGTLPTSFIQNLFSESTLLDTGTSDHVVALHQLKDQIANLQRQLQIKDQQMLQKEKQGGEIKAQHGIIERELRLKIQAMQKTHNDVVEDLQSKVRVLQKQVITLGKANKKGKDTDSPNRL